MDPTSDLMLSPTDADPQQLLRDLLAISQAPQAAKTGATASTFPPRRVLAPTPMPTPKAGPMAPPAGPPSMPSSGDPSADGGGTDWRGILRLIAPAIGSLVAGGGHQMPAFWSAYQGRQTEMDQERQRQQLALDNKRKAAAEFLLQTEHDAEGYDDPVLLAQHLSAADEAGALAGFTKPGDLKNKYTVSPNKLAQKKLDELNTLLDNAEKGGYNVDDLAASGAVLTTKDGAHVPVATAIDLTRKRPLDAQGQPVSKPIRAAGTEEERFLQQRAKDYGFKSLDAVDADTQLNWRREFRDAGRADKTVAPGGVDAQFNDLVELWKTSHKGQDPPADVRTKLRVQAKKEIGQADDRQPVTVNIPGLTDMSPQQRVDSAAQDIVAGRMAPSQLATFFTGMGKDSASQLRSLVMQRVKQLQPDFNFAAAESNFQFGKNTGTQNTVRYLDSVQESMPLLIDRATKLNNGNIRGINALVNAGKNQINDVDLKRFQTDVLFVADEVAKILQGGGTGSGTSDAKLKQAASILSTSDSPQAISAALADINTLLGNRRRTLTKGTYLEKPETPATTPAPIKVGGFTVKVKP